MLAVSSFSESYVSWFQPAGEAVTSPPPPPAPGTSAHAERDPAAAAKRRGRSLPCLFSNNSTEWELNEARQKWNKLATNHRNAARALRENVRLLAFTHGLKHLVFGVLTFDPKRKSKTGEIRDLTNYHEAQRHFNSLATHCFAMFKAWIAVMERHKSGIIHYHTVGVVEHDVWTNHAGDGFIDYDACVKGDGRTANRHLKAIWRYFGNPERPGKAAAHGFGRNGWLPIRSSEEAIGKYVGKYVAKHIDQREERDKGARLVRYSKGAAAWSTRFTVVGYEDKETGRSVFLEAQWLFRHKFGALATALGFSPEDYGTAPENRGQFLPFKRMFGDGWAFWLGPIIESIRLPVYPTGAHADLDYPGFMPDATPKELRNMLDVRFTPSDSRKSLATAVSVALDSRKDTQRHREQRQWALESTGARETAEGQGGVCVVPARAGTWIERTCGHDD